MAGAATAAFLPNSDEELLEWIEMHIERLAAQQGRANVLLNFNYASEYYPGVRSACVLPLKNALGFLLVHTPVCLTLARHLEKD